LGPFSLLRLIERNFPVARKPTYEQLEQRVKELEREVSECNRIAKGLKEEQRVFIGGPVVVFRWLATENWPATYVSPNVSQFGYQADDFVSGRLPYTDIIQREALDKVLSEVKEYTESGVPFYEQEYPIIQADGETRWVHDFTIVRRNEKSEITHYDGYILDVTRRKQAEEALKESEEKYRELFEMESDAIFLIENSTGRILEVNQAASVLYGYSKEELLQKRNTDLSAESEDTRAATVERRTYVPVRYHRKRDGIVFPVEITARHFSWQGREVHIAAIRDITDRKHAEETLRESEFKFRTLFDSSPQAIALTELQTGKLVDVNVKFCEVTKYAAEEIIGRTTTECEFYSEADRARFMDEFKGAGEVLGLEMDFKIKDGSTLHTQMFSRFIQIRNKELLLTMFLDMTEQKRLEVQLRQAQKMEAIGTLAGGIAHDFNNLLMGIQGRTSLMFMDVGYKHPHFLHLRGIEDMVKRGAHLTKQLLGFARGGKYEVRATDLNDLIENSLEMFGRTRKEIKTLRKYQKDIWPVEVDRGQIEQVLLNVFVNAWQAMPGGGALYLETQNVTLDKNLIRPFDAKPGNYVKVSITDTGVGMDETARQRVFEPFFSTKEMGGGTGLGLASAYGIIKNHGGIINVQSELGQGTTIDIYLPASDTEVAEEEEFSAVILGGTESLLLVDDEDTILDVGKEMLTTLGYKVMLARSGKEAIELYKKNENKIDMVILDMIMPDMGGGEVYDRLKEINPHIKVLLSSGYSMHGQASQILQRGCDGFIQKPFDMKRFSRAIRGILEKA
jgi:two-component system cell cycle sensor histidine kinase/response regulator CckA